MDLKAMIDRWAEDVAIGGADPRTIAGYRYSLLHFEKFLGRPITKAGKMEIRAYVDMQRKRGLTTATIRNRLNALSSFYEFLIFEGKRKDNPVREVRARYLNQYKSDSEKHTHKIISVDDAKRLVEYFLDVRDQAMILLMLKTGVRRGELLSMETRDINWQEQSITLKPTKKRSNRTVFFDGETAYVLQRWLDVRATRSPDSLALWISTWGKKIDYGSLKYSIEKAALACGLHDPTSSRMEDHFSAHCCRHWFTTHLLRAGMRREYVAWIRGDSRREAIDIYDHIDPEDVRRAYLARIPQLGI
jgi:integrase/recombinase XerD